MTAARTTPRTTPRTTGRAAVPTKVSFVLAPTSTAACWWSFSVKQGRRIQTWCGTRADEKSARSSIADRLSRSWPLVPTSADRALATLAAVGADMSLLDAKTRLSVLKAAREALRAVRSYERVGAARRQEAA